MAVLRTRPATAARALELTILTAARSGEALGARWREFDLDAATWTVPAARMKAAREHRVPLSAPAVALLRALRPLSRGPDSPVFPGARDARKPLSNMAMEMLLRRMNAPDPDAAPDTPTRWHDCEGRAITVHGFRSTFRDWVAEVTEHPGDIAEAALAHKIADKVEAAYRRGDLFSKRIRLMADWAAWCEGQGPLAAPRQVAA